MSEDKKQPPPPPSRPIHDGEGKRYASDNLPVREQRVVPKPPPKKD